MSTRGNNLDTSKPVEIIPYCPLDISKVTSSEFITSKPFHIAELNQPSKLHIHLRSYVDFYGGYADHGRAILFGLNDSGECIVKLSPIVSMIDVDPFIVQKCSWFMRNPAFKLDKSIFLTIAGPGWMQGKFQPDNRYSVAWTMIESRSCHPDMKEWLSNVNEVWAPTDCDMLRFKSLELPEKTKLVKMNLGYDSSKYNIHARKMDIPVLKGRYVFGVLGSWNKRKGIKKIIEAFCNAFTGDDPVSLLLICKYGTRPYDGIKDGEQVTKTDTSKWDIVHEFKRWTSKFSNMPHITLVDIPIHENVLPNLVQNIDCGVGFSMGESTWLPGLQMMGMRKPVIQLESQCSGFTEYMNSHNSYLCKKVKYIEADEELYKGTSDYYKGQSFAEGDEFELADMMKRVYSERDSDKQDILVRRAESDVKESWTWENSVRSVISRFKEIKFENR